MKALLFYGRLILSLALILYLITILDLERIKYILPRLRLEFVWQTFFLLLLSILVLSIRWSALLVQLNIRQNILDSWRYYIVSMFYGITLPGIIGADVVRLGLSIKKHGTNKVLLTTSVLFERTCGIITIVMIAAVTALLAPSPLISEQSIINPIYVLAFTGTVGFILFFVVLKMSPERWFNMKKDENNIIAKTRRLFAQFRGLPLKLLLSVLLLSALANFFDILGSFFLAKALHIEQPLTFFLLIIPLVYIVTSLPISLGGLGIREGVLTFFLVKAGVRASDAVIFAFLIYFNRIIVALIGGFVQFFNQRS